MYTKWFDYDKIRSGLVLRYRRNGDYMVIRGNLKKTLRRILVDDKIPQNRRDSMLLLAEGNHILWIPDSGRISEYYKVTEATKRILSAELKENEDEGKD
jgi:tRNA(Ile)-lysidine synthase